ncbi:MAG: PP0621 family protein [Betaproteobacteria bacterium]
MKFLVVLVLVVVGIWILASRVRKPHDRGQGRSTGATSGASPQAAPSEGGGAGKAIPGQMVACRRCGVHLPADEAVFDGQLPYCGPSHRQAGPR